MTNRVGLVDYGAGNMFSIEHALRAVGADVVIIADAEEWRSSDPGSVVLPGVGAFGQGVQALRERGLAAMLVEHSNAGLPLLGICLGAQLLLEESSEFGHHVGLGIIAGTATPFDSTIVRVPHIGWAQVNVRSLHSCRLFDDVGPGSWMYFVHSYHLLPSHDEDVLSESQIGHLKFASAIQRGATFGVQFHPEKSGVIGLTVLRNFVELGEPE